MSLSCTPFCDGGWVCAVFEVACSEMYHSAVLSHTHKCSRDPNGPCVSCVVSSPPPCRVLRCEVLASPSRTLLVCAVLVQNDTFTSDVM